MACGWLSGPSCLDRLTPLIGPLVGWPEHLISIFASWVPIWILMVVLTSFLTICLATATVEMAG